MDVTFCVHLPLMKVQVTYFGNRFFSASYVAHHLLLMSTLAEILVSRMKIFLKWSWQERQKQYTSLYTDIQNI